VGFLTFIRDGSGYAPSRPRRFEIYSLLFRGVAYERRRRRNGIRKLATHPAVKVIGVIKRIAACLPEGRSAANDGIFCEGPRRARIAPFLMDVLGGFSAPKQSQGIYRSRIHARPHVLDAGHLPAT
jgi:hypothetical protein